MGVYSPIARFAKNIRRLIINSIFVFIFISEIPGVKTEAFSRLVLVVFSQYIFEVSQFSRLRSCLLVFLAVAIKKALSLGRVNVI